MHLTESHLTFLAHFAKGPDGKAFLSLLREKLADTDQRLRIAEGPELHRQQGRAQELDEIIDAVTSADRKLITIASAPRRQRAFVDSSGPAVGIR